MTQMILKMQQRIQSYTSSNPPQFLNHSHNQDNTHLEETKPQKIKWWLISIPIWLTAWLTHTANQAQREGEH